ncbi:hypothetical protein FOS14_10470 [Skermania sp. ID1734]|uniref:hypothetical protein n=1 Tax=Skermania sp. ID1734 TaxID=2597516 RepID=UPI00117FA845|nr:hypothetical protein [Skermania sp. ID1734]TSD99688.1 hypothetical protein FOS14_10470 [Skermania sp. ID1734]
MSTRTDPTSRLGLGQPGLAALGAGLVGVVLVVVAPFAQPAIPSAGAGAVGLAATVGSLVVGCWWLTVAVALVTSRKEFAGGLLSGASPVWFGLAVLDIAFLSNPIDANRFELVRPLTAAPLHPGAGAFLVLAGHVLLGCSGLLGSLMLRSSDDGAADVGSGLVAAQQAGPVWWSSAVVVAAVAVGALFFAPWTSGDPVIVVKPIFAAAILAVSGTVVVALALVVVTAIAFASGSVPAAAGAIVGSAVALLSLVAPRLAAASDTALQPTTALWVSVLAGAGLAGLGTVLPIMARRSREDRRQVPGWRVEQWSVQRWHAIAGAAAVTAAVLIALGSLLPVVHVANAAAQPFIPACRLTLVAAVVLAIAAVWLLLSEFALAVRPAAGVLTMAAVLSCGGPLQAGVVAGQVAGVGFGVGFVLISVGAVVAAVAGALVCFAGAAERDDVDRSVDVVSDRNVMMAGAAGAVLSVLALAFPLFGSDSGGDAAAFTVLPWGWDTWLQAGFAVVVVACAVVAAAARPARGTALLAGCAIGMGVYLIGWPLTSSRMPEPSVGLGAIFAIAAVVAFVIAAVFSERRSAGSVTTQARVRRST